MNLDDLDEAVEETRRVSEEFGKTKERLRVIGILDYILKRLKDEKIKDKKIKILLDGVREAVLVKQE